MGKYNKSSNKNIFKHKEDITWSEVDVEKNGKVTRLVVPDGKFGYGDTESHAQLTGDLADKHSDDTKAGEKAYEKAREQSDQDWEKRKNEIEMQQWLAKNPVLDVKVISDKYGEPIQELYTFQKTSENGLVYKETLIVDLISNKVTKVIS